MTWRSLGDSNPCFRRERALALLPPTRGVIRETIGQWRSLVIFSRTVERFAGACPRRSDWLRGCSGRL